MYTLLLIGNDIDSLMKNKDYFKKIGYRVVTLRMMGEALNKVKAINADCIILDLMESGLDRLSICQRLTHLTDCPIIVLSYCDSEEAKEQIILSGADDYIVKPYSMNELTIRVVANVRRYQRTKKQSDILLFPPIEIDLKEHIVSYEGDRLYLTNQEYQIFSYLVRNMNRVITFEELGKEIWGSYRIQDQRVIMVCISRLRKKLSSYLGLNEMIETIWAKGYQFTYCQRKEQRKESLS